MSEFKKIGNVEFHVEQAKALSKSEFMEHYEAVGTPEFLEYAYKQFHPAQAPKAEPEAKAKK